jgi:hypothetical protein
MTDPAGTVALLALVMAPTVRAHPRGVPLTHPCVVDDVRHGHAAGPSG